MAKQPMKYGKPNAKEYPSCPGGRYGGRKVQTPGAAWSRQVPHNPPNPKEGGKSWLQRVQSYLSRYGEGESRQKGGQKTSTYLTPKKKVRKALDEASNY